MLEWFKAFFNKNAPSGEALPPIHMIDDVPEELLEVIQNDAIVEFKAQLKSLTPLLYPDPPPGLTVTILPWVSVVLSLLTMILVWTHK